MFKFKNEFGLGESKKDKFVKNSLNQSFLVKQLQGRRFGYNLIVERVI